MKLNNIFGLLFFIKFIIIVYCDNTSTLPTLKRTRRHLGFKQETRIFFRINIKDNVLKVHQIFAHSYGFRCNWDIKYPLPKSYKVRRRDVHESLEELMNHHGFDGRACHLRNLCEASKPIEDHSGMIYKLFQMVYRNSSSESDFVSDNKLGNHEKINTNNCDELYSQCPFSLMELSTYTDI